ncbi:MAG: DivIVA domain-containing protein, partial [Solobacterium sp.]|nr:DivIVA domain-containing protein [Solobacterium sp.]
MTASRPTFRIMKSGYDRFAVDDAIERYAAQIDQLENRMQLYQQQLLETTRQFDDLRARYVTLMQRDEARAQAAEDIARLSLREANDIIDTAKHNADVIVAEALQSARVVLLDLARL